MYINREALHSAIRNANVVIGKDGQNIYQTVNEIVAIYAQGLTADAKAESFKEGFDRNYFHVYSAFNSAELTQEERDEKVYEWYARADRKYMAAGRKLIWLSSRMKEILGEGLLGCKLDREVAADCSEAVEELVSSLEAIKALRRA